MSEFNEAIYQERERELVRRLGVAEAALVVESAARDRALAGEADALAELASTKRNLAYHREQEKEARDKGREYEQNMKRLASALQQIRDGIKVLDSGKLTDLLGKANGLPEVSWYEEFHA